MLVIAYAPILAAALGAIIYFVATKAEVKEMGRLVFFAGVLWALYAMIGQSVHIGKGP